MEKYFDCNKYVLLFDIILKCYNFTLLKYFIKKHEFTFTNKLNEWMKLNEYVIKYLKLRCRYENYYCNL